MATARGVATRWLSDDFPGFLEVVLTDADQVAHVIHDKAPVLGRGEWSSTTDYPREIWIDADVIGEHRNTVTVRLAHSVESLDGRRDFELPTTLVRP